MARLNKTNAFVLKKRSLLHKDSLVTLFTEEFGKITVIAKGMRLVTSRRLVHCQTGNFINVTLGKKNSVFYLQESSLISAFLTIKEHEKKTQSLYFILYVLDKLLPEREENRDVFALLKKYIIELSRSNMFTKKERTVYFNQCIQLLGYSEKDVSYEELMRMTSEIMNEKMPLFDI